MKNIITYTVCTKILLTSTGRRGGGGGGPPGGGGGRRRGGGRQLGGAGVVGKSGTNHPVSSSYSLFVVCTRHASFTGIHIPAGYASRMV